MIEPFYFREGDNTCLQFDKKPEDVCLVGENISYMLSVKGNTINIPQLSEGTYSLIWEYKGVKTQMPIIVKKRAVEE